MVFGTGEVICSLAVAPVLPRTANVFVSRMSPSVTARDVMLHCRKNVPNVNRVEKFKWRPERGPCVYSSFVIVVPAECAQTVLNPASWPAGTLLKTFGGRLHPDAFEKNESTESDDSQEKMDNANESQSSAEKPTEPTCSGSD